MSVSVLISPDVVPPPALEAHWLGQLPAARRAELARWPDGRARQRSLLAGRLLAAGLRRLGHPAAALATLRRSAQGRPSLDLPVDFSLSHCEGRVVCALSTGGPVGVDVEALGPLRAAAFPLYLNADERAWAGRSARRFYAIWTRKEAVAKAAGSSGLAALPRIDTSRHAGGACFEGRLWHTPAVPVGPGHVAHLALADAPAGLAFEQLDPAVL
jgi:4'-phosphopantetheinyl transferase